MGEESTPPKVLAPPVRDSTSTAQTTPTRENKPISSNNTPGSNPKDSKSSFPISSYAENCEEDVIKRLSKSQQCLKALVEQAREHDPEAFLKAREEAEVSHPSSGKNHFAAADLSTLCEEFNLKNVEEGLTSEQVLSQRAQYGPNCIEKEKNTPVWKIFLHQFASLIVLLLCAASIVCLALQELVEGIAIFIIVLLNASLATYMEKAAGDALAKLASMAAPQCVVLRDGGQHLTIDAMDLVPGDIVCLCTGSSVPADLRVISTMELKANEAILTGESEDVKKSLKAQDESSPFATNLCFASTSITNGNGVGMVFATGMDTQVGRIATQLKKAGKGSKLTPLQRGLNRLGGLIGILAVCVLIVIVIIAIVTDYTDPAHPDKDKVLTIVLVAVGFAVSSIPEGLPMVVTISLSLGARDMVKRKANVRKLPAVETLGCCSVICSDKTGTLTEGKMTAMKVVTFARKNADKPPLDCYALYPSKGFDPNGGIFEEDELSTTCKDAMMQKYAKNTFQSYDDILFDYGNPQNEPKNPKVDRVRALMLTAHLNSYATRLEKDENTGAWVTAGNMSEGALVVAAAKARWGRVANPKDQSMEQYSRIEAAEVPFSSSRKMMVTVHKLFKKNYFNNIRLDKSDSHEFEHCAIIKGAPDRVIKSVGHILEESAEGNVRATSEIRAEEISAFEEVNLRLSNSALRVLGFCLRPLSSKDMHHLTEVCDGADEKLHFLLGSETGEKPLILLGAVGSLDPARPGVAEAIATCEKAGVRVIMITGDQKPTAMAIGKEIGLVCENGDKNNEKAIQCQELHVDGDPSKDYLPIEDLYAIVSRVCIFARAQPEDKIEIVNALKLLGNVVAMTGDGVNDAPALKAADIGVAMGIVGTDVAKGAAEMVLLDDNFCTIVGAVDEGRKIYANIQKFVSFLLGTNIGEIIYLTIAIACSLPLPLEALQILFLNLMSDGCPAVALSREPADADNMTKPPRPKKEPIMTRDYWLFGILPHTIFEAACVLGSLCVALYMSMGVLRLDDIESQCFYNRVNVNGSSGTTRVKHLCRTFEYRVGADYVGWVTNIDYWDPGAEGVKQYLGAVKGKRENLTPYDTDMPSEIRNAFAGGCLQGTEARVTAPQGWCKPSESISHPTGDRIPGSFVSGYRDVTARGSRIARTQSFMTAVWCEMLRAYTVRSWEWAHKVFNRNPWMHFACSTSATLTTLVTIVPGITYVFSTTYLAWWQYLLAISWGFVNLIFDEIVPKPLFRYIRNCNRKKKLALKAKQDRANDV